MESLGGRSWKEYYSREREMNKDLIDAELLKWWEMDDPVVDDIFEKGGALSFPHTFLSASMIPIIRTVRGILRSGKKNILALGVMHGVSGFDPVSEFSLDGFEYLLDRAGDILNIDIPDITKTYLPSDTIDRDKPDQIFDSIKKEVQKFESGYSKMDSIVLTGDLVHYGKLYGSKVIEDEQEVVIQSSIRNEL